MSDRLTPTDIIANHIMTICSDGGANPHEVAADIVATLAQHGFSFGAFEFGPNISGVMGPDGFIKLEDMTREQLIEMLNYSHRQYLALMSPQSISARARARVEARKQALSLEPGNPEDIKFDPSLDSVVQAYMQAYQDQRLRKIGLDPADFEPWAPGVPARRRQNPKSWWRHLFEGP